MLSSVLLLSGGSARSNVFVRETMEGSFRPNILMDKLSKLNNTQQSIETLSHWCIFHMNKAKQVVETWEKQFHFSPREQRLAFLYLANDIIQNSRRKGADFVAEFWKVLPDALRDVIANGDEFSRKSALRLVSIWEERKVFGTRGQILKEEFIKKKVENGNRIQNHSGFKLQPHSGSALDKLVCGYQAVYGSNLDEHAIFGKCRSAISFIEKVDKDAARDCELGNAESSVTVELKEQQATLRDCIEQLLVVESSRTNLASLLREALEEQEHQLNQVRDHRQAAQKQLERVDNICLKLLSRNGSSTPVLAERSNTLNSDPQMTPSFMVGTGEQSNSNSMINTQQASFTENSGQIADPKSAAAAVAAKLASSTSSAQMLTLVLSSLASEGVVGDSIKESSSDYHWNKRAKVGNDHPSYIPRNSEAPGRMQHTLPVTSQELNNEQAPPPPPPTSSPPPPAPLPPSVQQLYTVPQYVPTAMPLPNGSFGYNLSQQAPMPRPSYSPFPGTSEAPPPDGYQHYTTVATSYGQPSALPLTYTHGQ